MVRKDAETGSVLERLRDLERLRQDLFVVSPSSPVFNLDGLPVERIDKIKAIALALYDAEIAVARAKLHTLCG